MPSSQRRLMAGSDPVLHGSVAIGHTHPQERLEVSVLLRRRGSSPGLPSLEELSAQLIREPLSREDFAELHGSDAEDVAAVEAFAREHNLQVLEHNQAHRIMRLSGTAQDVSRAFGVQLVNVAHPRGNHRSHTGPVSLPEELAGVIQCVLNLETRPVARPHVRTFAQSLGSPCSVQAPGDTGEPPVFPPVPRPFLPPEVARLYNFPSGSDGEGQSVAILEFGGGYRRRDLAAYFRRLGLPLPRITDVSVDGGANQPGSKEDTEVYLDLEVLGSIAPGAEITVYFAPNTSASWVQALKQAIHDPRRNHSVISISWAAPEKSWRPADIEAINETLWEAAALGITVCISSGDYGASSENPKTDGYAHVEFPSSSPFALACGGTWLYGAGDAIACELVWHQGTGASGGGASAVFPSPPYQEKAGVQARSVNPGYKTGRGVPDVAGDADPATGYLIEVNGAASANGGTSAVAPLWAALVARLNQRLGRTLGFLNPALYQIRNSGGALRDILWGNNVNAPWVGGYFAGQGWDACTGWGSPNGEALLEALSGLAPEPARGKATKRDPPKRPTQARKAARRKPVKRAPGKKTSA